MYRCNGRNGTVKRIAYQNRHAYCTSYHYGMYKVPSTCMQVDVQPWMTAGSAHVFTSSMRSLSRATVATAVAAAAHRRGRLRPEMLGTANTQREATGSAYYHQHEGPFVAFRYSQKPSGCLPVGNIVCRSETWLPVWDCSGFAAFGFRCIHADSIGIDTICLRSDFGARCRCRGCV